MPGHEKFVKQMVAGAGGVDLALLVVAADEGVMPQTIEHLEILDSLGVRGGVVVMTKTDLVDEDILAVATEEARELVEGTFLAGKPLVAGLGAQGTGPDRGSGRPCAPRPAACAERSAAGPFRMPMDRVFTMPGVGVVVTGTCWSGQVAEGDRLLVRARRADRCACVRSRSTAGRLRRGARASGWPWPCTGSRRTICERGFQLTAAGACQVTRRLDLRVNLMPHYRGTVKNRQRLHVHHAGREVLGRIVLLDEKELGGDGRAAHGPGPAAPGGPAGGRPGRPPGAALLLAGDLIAGGIVLDPDARAPQALRCTGPGQAGGPGDRRQRRALRPEAARRPACWGFPWPKPDRTGTIAQARIAGKRVYHRTLLARPGRAASGSLLVDYSRRFPLRLGMPKEEARRRCKFKGGPPEWNAICQTLAAAGGWVLAGRPDRSEPRRSPAVRRRWSPPWVRCKKSWRAPACNGPGWRNSAPNSAGFPASHEIAGIEGVRAE